MNSHPDMTPVLGGLKDFQRTTVDYVFDRFYGQHDPTSRFLVADEVGLGKTLVARGVIARTINHLWRKVDRIDIVYVCSNADIARQNVRRLSIPGFEIAAQSTRLTLLPLHLGDLQKTKVNFVALTPATSFEQTGGGGRIDERAVLYWLLDQAWGIHGSRAALYVLQDYATTASFERAIHALDRSSINQQIAADFVARLANQIREEQGAGKPDLRQRFDDLKRNFSRVDSRPGDEATKRRTRWIGELRRLLARVCIGALSPDIIVLDEFQRFKHLLEEESEAGELARHLFESNDQEGAKVLLLSATPYRGLSYHHEKDENHYADFISLLQFLENADVTGCKQILAEYSSALPAANTPAGLSRLRIAKDALETRLRRVMARTERSSVEGTNRRMLIDAPSPGASLGSVDVSAFLGAQQIADVLKHGDMVEYWKSAPYLLNFMDLYALKTALENAVDNRDIIRLVRTYPETFLDLDRARNYQELEPANPRLRGLLEETINQGMWRLLWMPPAISYYALSGPFAMVGAGKLTKRLVFSSWHMVPRAVASLLSYEAERRMMRANDPRAELKRDDWTKQRGLLRFNVSEGRLTGLPLFLFVYPCVTFARDCDPRELARGASLTAEEVISTLKSRVANLVEHLSIDHEVSGPVDERWYWLAPMLLDFRSCPEIARAWWETDDLPQVWAGAETAAEDEAWSRHVSEAQATISALADGSLRLGLPPADLPEVLAFAACAAPATAALRAFVRASRSDGRDCSPLLLPAAQTGRAFLSLFNHAEVTEMLRAEFSTGPYWVRVLQYCHAGCLQATLDEYSHLLREALGCSDDLPLAMAEKMAAELIEALTLRTASLRVDEITAPPYARELKIKSESMHIRFAMRFGDERSNDEVVPGGETVSGATRKERVRAAFNSPFWPFVLISTSLGQEGLDFHHYCHAITHWNLPSNPVDLEQREGRIHRFKGHAVRKNVAGVFAADALRDPGSDIWHIMFEMAREKRASNENDLVPFWMFPGDAKIERHVPAIPFSREVQHLHDLRRALAIYRMVFGQSRQEDLISYILTEIPEEDRLSLASELRMDLMPRTVPH
ncbi:helicase [Bradyrhizobium diazoefficiens]|uniref:Putative helicase n=4 Tax=Nitrobacteraceae TaxID=41294 RepID=A0A837CP00_9BRAD|nr:hypothetical protein BD122_18895 [Bradyrhizobium diazoefficiens]KGJ71070.1 putative helicase [Bradyrhizobium diazoefficiens SEMIA 5080]KOY08348.1 hypothetical protein AF336_17470 [Bradyrhizobium diazoefficiens]